MRLQLISKGADFPAGRRLDRQSRSSHPSAHRAARSSTRRLGAGLKVSLAIPVAGIWIALAVSPARADDRAEISTSLFAEQRDGGKGGLTVIHPQADLGVDLGRFVTLDVSYSADAV